MSTFQERTEAQTRQIIGQMLGDELLVQEGTEPRRDRAAIVHRPQGW